MDVDAEIARVQLQIEKVENDILKVEKDIQQADNALQSGGLTPEEKNYSREQKQALREEKQDLRGKERALREEKNKWLDLKLKNVHAPGLSGFGPSMDDYLSRLERHFRAITKVVNLAMRPAFQLLRRAPSVARSDNVSRDADLKKTLLQIFYDIVEPVYVLQCPVTKLILPSFDGRAGHIFPMRAQQFLGDLCPDIPDINHPSNAILWAEPIEQAFEISSICFTWAQGSHTLTPWVLDVHLLGKNMLKANEYMKGSSANSKIADRVMTPEEMESFLKKMDQTKLIKSGKERERERNLVQVTLQPYINSIYAGISFDDINGKPIQLPEWVQLSEVAFCWHAVLAIEEAKRRGVLPEGFALDANKANFDLIDLYFASQQDVNMSDDSFVDLDSSFEEDVYAGFDDSSITRCWTGKPSVDGQSSR